MAPKTINYKKKSLHVSVSPYLIDGIDKLVDDKKFSSRSDFTSVACEALLKEMEHKTRK